MHGYTELLGLALEIISAQHGTQRTRLSAERRVRSCHEDVRIRRERLNISEDAGHAQIFGQRIAQHRSRQDTGYTLAGWCGNFVSA